MLVAVGVHFDEALVGAEALLGLIAYSVQGLYRVFAVGKDPTKLIGGVALGWCPSGLSDSLAKLGRTHQLAVLGPCGGRDAFIDESATQVVDPGVEEELG